MTFLGILAVALAIAGYVPYLLAVWRRGARPNRASWWIFAVSSIAGTASSWAAGARWTLGVPITFAVCCVIVGLFAIRRGEGGWSRLDRVCLAIAGASLVAWWASGDPLPAVFMNCCVDLAGTIPTAVKAWRDPEREDGVGWLLWLAADICNLAQPTAFGIADLLYPVALTIAAAAVVVARYRHVVMRRQPV